MNPCIGILCCNIKIYGASSLKDRRQVVRSLLERLKRHFNVSAGDMGPDDCWDRAEVAVSCVGSSLHEMESRVSQIGAFIERMEDDGAFELLALRREVFFYGDLQN